MSSLPVFALSRARVVIFLVVVAIPGVFTAFPSLDRKSTENRVLASYPEFKGLGDLPVYLKGVEVWFNDHFGLRNCVIQNAAWFRWHVFHTSPTKRILPGNDGWLYYWSENDETNPNEGNTVADFMGEQPYSQAELDQIDSALHRADTAFRRLGMTFAVLVGPNQATIYPEHLPWWMRLNRGRSRMDQLFAQLRRTANPVIAPDVRPVLLEAKTQGPLYYRTDTHWTYLGAFAAYEELMSQLREERPGLRALGPKDVSFVFGQGYWGGNAQMAGLTDEVDTINVNPGIVSASRFKSSNGKVLVFHDSFYGGLDPFFVATFSAVTRVQHVWQAPKLDIVLEEKPDIVVYVVVERLAMKALPRFSSAVDGWEQELATRTAAPRRPDGSPASSN